jgi:hypothetical protein
MPRETFAEWGGTCSQGGCHPVYHTSGFDHTSVQDAGCETLCHDETYVFTSVDGCLTCHDDVTPPVSTLAADAYYNTPTLFDIPYSSVDAESGVATQYYTVDGGLLQTASGFVRESYSQGPHTIDYWATDVMGNAETTKSASFIVDWTPPLVSSDAVPEYPASGATITIFGSDPPSGSGNSGLQFVQYQLDGGPVVTGDSGLQVNVLTTGSHTLQIRSRDNAGNWSSPGTVLFTVGGATTGTIRISHGGGQPPAGSEMNYQVREAWVGGALVDTGSRVSDGGANGWVGVDDIEVPVSPTVPYWVRVYYYDSVDEFGYNTTWQGVFISYAGQIVEFVY